MLLIVIAVFFVILGLLIKNAKMYFLIAGYNTMSKEEKAKYDIEGIATVFRNTMFGMALLLLIGLAIALQLENPKIELYSIFITMMIGLPYLLVTSNSSKYKKPNKNG